MQLGDEVIVPANTNTYIATILAVTKNNLVPILVEFKPNTLLGCQTIRIALGGFK